MHGGASDEFETEFEAWAWEGSFQLKTISGTFTTLLELHSLELTQMSTLLLCTVLHFFQGIHSRALFPLEPLHSGVR